MMNSKKILALLLAALMLLPTLVACDNTGTKETKDPTETTAPEAQSTETADPHDRASIPDNLPAMNFDGKEFRILTTTGELSNGTETNWEAQYIFDEDVVGDSLNDALRKRNEDVENRFNAKIKTVLTYGEVQETMMRYVQAQMDEYEVADLMQYMSWVPLVYGLSLNWMDVPHINLDQPWWNKQSNDQATINGQLYRLTGDLSLTSLQMCWALAFNMGLLEDWGYTPDKLYQLVFDGEWTIDKMIEITADIYVDNDKSNTKTKDDTFGHTQWTMTGTDPWLLAIDAEILAKNEEGKLEIKLGDEKVYNTLEKLNNYIYTSKGVYGYAQLEDSPLFADGNIAIISAVIGDCSDDFSKLSFDYGLLPYPKYDTAQENYVTTGVDQLSVYCLPVSTPQDRYDFIGIMMEALCAESYKTVYPAYFDGALKGRYSTDPNMAKVMDVIVEGRRFDLAYYYGIYIDRLPYQFRYCIRDNATDLASRLAEKEAAMADALDLLDEFFATGEQIWY